MTPGTGTEAPWSTQGENTPLGPPTLALSLPQASDPFANCVSLDSLPTLPLARLRAPSLPQEYVPELTEAFAKVGVSWKDFALTDNTCGPEPRRKIVKPPDLDTFVEDVEVIEDDLKSFGKGFTVLRRDLDDGKQKLENDFRDEVQREKERAERALARVERKYAKKFPFLEILLNGGRVPS